MLATKLMAGRPQLPLAKGRFRDGRLASRGRRASAFDDIDRQPAPDRVERAEDDRVVAFVEPLPGHPGCRGDADRDNQLSVKVCANADRGPGDFVVS